MKQLTIEQVIKILCDNEVLFSASIAYFGEDTNWEEIEFSVQDERYNSFVFYMDLDIHGCNISSDTDMWFFKVRSQEDLFKVIDANREKFTDPLSPAKN